MADKSELEEEPGKDEAEEPGKDEAEEGDFKELGEEEDTIPVFLRDEEPTGEEDRAKYLIMRDQSLSNTEIAEAHDLKEGTVRVARSHLGRDGHIQKERQTAVTKKTPAAVTTAPPRTPQVFAKGSPPEAIIESIKIPTAVGEDGDFEQGMKFGMTTLVLATRIMQELAAVSMQQVKPLIDMTKTVREGEGLAYKSGADEAAYKAAAAMGQTIMPMMSNMEANIAAATKGSESDPMKAMMVRTMEPMIQNLMTRMVPGQQKPNAPGWTKKQE